LPILVDESAALAPLASHPYRLDSTGNTPLRATLVYRDPAGVPGAAVHRINDLSLRITSPSGLVYWGNNGLDTGNWSQPGGVSNQLDTVENVFIENPEAGTWKIDVLGDEIVEDGHVGTPEMDAVYALVASGGTRAAALVPSASSPALLVLASALLASASRFLGGPRSHPTSAIRRRG
ncbi:MAG: hypothetical protein AAEJ53_16005, partial [Myxococcota bacterium]